MSKVLYESSANEFRSDTFTTPTESMIRAGLSATIGDSVYNEDSDTIALQEKVAAMYGKEAGLYCVSGTMSNQIAIRTHLRDPPYSIICDHRAHIYNREAAGLAMLSGTMVTPVIPSNGDYLTVEDIKEAIIPEDGDIHAAPTRLICLENTLHGIVFPTEELRRIRQFCTENGYPLHCDGARIWNAAVATGTEFKEYGEIFDTISICLSKSLGAPIGSVLVGPKHFLKKANHFKKQVGGGIRQSGMMCKMASVAIDENLPKLVKSHQMARELGDFLVQHGIALESPVDSNFVFIDTKQSPIDRDLLIRLGRDKYNVRLMGPRVAFHYQVSREALDNVKLALLEAYQETKKLGNVQPHKFAYVIEGN